MNITDFRTEERKEGFFRKTAKFFKYNKIALIFTVIIVVHIILAVFGNKGLITRLKLDSKRRELEKQLQLEINKGDELKKEIDELNNSDKKLEKTAREKYGMIKEGEVIYKIQVDSSK